VIQIFNTQIFNEAPIEDLPCYMCLCLAVCRGRRLGELMNCKLAYDYIHKYVDKGNYPYVGNRYSNLVAYMRLYKQYIVE